MLTILHNVKNISEHNVWTSLNIPLSATDLGLPSLEPVLGEPGGEGCGVGPFPLALDSPRNGSRKFGLT